MSSLPEISEVEVVLDAAGLGGEAVVGRLVKQSSRTGDTLSFAYSNRWIDGHEPVAPFELDPQLPLTPGRLHARAGASEITGAFDDCSPDRWGKKLMQRREVINAREEGRRQRPLRPWDFLIGVNDASRMGALRLRADGRWLDDQALVAPPLNDLRELQAIALKVDRGEEDDSDAGIRWIKQLIAPGASLGGARPKSGVRDIDGTLMLAKFPGAEDRHDVGLWEFLIHRLARAADIVMPDARLLRLADLGSTYAVKRFDRRDGQRVAYASAMTLLDPADPETCSYLDLVSLIENQGVPTMIGQDLAQLFRRAAFNVLVGNRDDHLRNHGFLRALDGWRLSPAFDVNPNPDKDVHVLAIDEDDPEPDMSHLLKTAPYYRLSTSAAAGIVAQVRAAVSNWESAAVALGARRPDIALMRTVIDPQR